MPNIECGDIKESCSKVCKNNWTVMQMQLIGLLIYLPRVNMGQYLQETVYFLRHVPRRCLLQDSSAPTSALTAARCSQLASEISFG